jgi:hypothetical protein
LKGDAFAVLRSHDAGRSVLEERNVGRQRAVIIAVVLVIVGAALLSLFWFGRRPAVGTPVFVDPVDGPKRPPDRPAPPPASINRKMDEELQQAFKELDEGRIAYEPARAMTQGTPEMVLVRIARGGTIDTETGFRDRAWVDRLKVSGSMSATLTGDPGDFEIVALSSDTQALVGSASDWVWRVTPLRSGNLPLILRVTARIHLSNGSQENYDLPVKTAQIAVRADRVWQAKAFWDRNWQWVLGSPMVLGALGWLSARALKRRRGRNPVGFGR